MKWFSLEQKQDSKSLALNRRWRRCLWLASLIISPIVGASILLKDVPQLQERTPAALPSKLIGNIEQTAVEVTVKIQNHNFLGSGIIISRQKHQYLVLTNQHVLRAGKPPFEIATADGKIYVAQVVTPQATTDDLALLSFVSKSERYKTARIGNSSRLKPGELLFAAGFPANSNQSERYKTTSAIDKAASLTRLGLKVTKGKVIVILDRPLQQGYQIGYDNHLIGGMSGGPLFNREGKVVGINGRHAYPLWEAPDFYEDNSQLCPPLQELIARSSLAIPIEKAANLALRANYALDYVSSNPSLPLQNRRLLSTITTENNSQTAINAALSSKHCQ